MVPIIILVASAAHIVLEPVRIANNAFKILYYCVPAHEGKLH